MEDERFVKALTHLSSRLLSESAGLQVKGVTHEAGILHAAAIIAHEVAKTVQEFSKPEEPKS